MNYKKILTISSCTILASALLAGSLAWFTDKEYKKNIFKTGSVDIDLRENEIGDTTGIKIDDIIAGTKIDKRIDIKVPKGTVKTILRIEFKQTLLKNGQEIMDKDNIFSNGVDDYPEFKPIFEQGYEKYWIQDENNKNVYYYNKVVDATENEFITERILNSVELTEKAQNKYRGVEYTIDIKADAIQATNGAYKDWIESTPFNDGVKSSKEIEKILKNITNNISN